MENYTSKSSGNPGKDDSALTKDRTPLFIGLVIVLILIIGFFVYKNNVLQNTNSRQAEELSQTILQLDSISGELDARIRTIQELGGEVDTLIKVREQLETEKRELLTQQTNQKKLITSLRDRVGGYRELLLAKDEEIAELQQLNKELLSENTELKTEKQELNESIRKINEAKSQLEEKIAFASRLKLQGMKVFAVSESGREREGEFRSRHIDQLKITFTVGENKVAPIEGKELLIRIVAPDGDVLFDVTRGSGTFIFEGRETFYTAKQEILYDRQKQEVTLFYDKGSDFATGLYEVEVYTDDYLIGEGTFVVK